MSITTMPTSWPPVVIGLMMGLYWLKVLALVVRTKRTAGRAANFIPPEPLGRLLRCIWVPVVVLWIFLPMLTPYVAGLPWVLAPVNLPGGLMVGWIAVAVAAAAFAMTWVCWIRMGTSWRMGIDPHERTKLVFNGPYAYVRHPIYGLSQVLMLAALATLPSPLMLLIAALHLGFMQWEVRREEKYLVLLHGTAYTEYVQRVGRFLPRFGSWK
jgi:protein-S-isoprenylcysteine O-methyltransferase Ste14